MKANLCSTCVVANIALQLERIVIHCRRCFMEYKHGGKASPLLFGGHDQFPSDVDKARLNYWQSPRGKNSVNLFLQHVAQNIVFSRPPLIFTSSREWEPM